MMNKFLTILLFLSITFMLSNCSDKEEDVTQDLVYYSLVSEKDTIAPGESTEVVSTASGSQLEYYWSATIGDILGSGAEVVYTASPCQAGTNQITCKITNGGNQSESKTINIVVYE
jgi:hypothetical protein